ncbi:hypothetical protein SRHO_G00048150 [Serrasalmus rhombeus]
MRLINYASHLIPGCSPLPCSKKEQSFYSQFSSICSKKERNGALLLYNLNGKGVCFSSFTKGHMLPFPSLLLSGEGACLQSFSQDLVLLLLSLILGGRGLLSLESLYSQVHSMIQFMSSAHPTCSGPHSPPCLWDALYIIMSTGRQHKRRLGSTNSFGSIVSTHWLFSA